MSRRLRSILAGVLMWGLMVAVQVELVLTRRRTQKALPRLLDAPVPRAAQELIGRLAVCSRGRPGLICGFQALPWGWSFTGIGLDDGSLWASQRPRLMHREDLDELVSSKEILNADYSRDGKTYQAPESRGIPCA